MFCLCASSASSIGVFKPHDVVFAEVGAGLDFDEFEVGLAGVFEAMDDAEGNVGGLVFGEQQGVFATGDFCGALDDDPVFGAVVFLQGQALAGFDDDALA